MSPETADLADLPTLIDLNGRRALVTGGAKGIGAAIAARLAQAGAHVTIADLDPDGRTTAEALVAAGRAASFVLCDITNASQLDEAVRSAADDGALDILVNNAGIFPTTGPIDDVTDAFVERMLEVNVRAQYSASRNAARFMTNGGSIVNLASIAAIRGGANITAYTVSKAAVVGLTRAFANELGPRNITVNAVAPGGIETDMSAWLSTPEGEAQALSMQALKRKGQPDDIANVIAFLTGPDGAWVTGRVIEASGGIKL